MANFVKFVKCTKESFDKVTTKDVNSLYFLEDIGEFYKGNTCFTESITLVEQAPEKPAKGKIYFDKSKDEAKFWDGTQWIQLNHVIDTELTDEKSTKNAVSGDAIKTYVANKLKTVSTDGVHAEVKVSAEKGNKLEQKSDGLFVKSDIVVQNAVEDELVKTDAEGNIQSAGVKVGGATLNTTPDVKTLATEIAVNAIKSELTGKLDGKLEKADIVTTITTEEPSESKLVSEKALSEYLSWTELS